MKYLMIKNKLENEEVEVSNFQFNQLSFSKETRDTIKWFVEKLNDRIQITEDTRNWCRVKDTRKMHSDLERSLETLIKLRVIDASVYSMWQEFMLSIC